MSAKKFEDEPKPRVFCFTAVFNFLVNTRLLASLFNPSPQRYSMMEPIFEAGELVRSYSLELEQSLTANTPAHDPRLIFVENEKKRNAANSEIASWRKFYEPWKPVQGDADPTTKMLKERAVLLSHAWKLFRTRLSKNEQDEIEGQVPSVEGLVGMVDIVASNWYNKRAASKSGKFMRYFTDFCGFLDAHSDILKCLPEGNAYVSLFTGVLKTIINASANHETIATGLAESLSRISVHIVACQKELELHITKDMQYLIAKLYAHVFLFLEETMDWYLKKPRLRFGDAFKNNYYERFEKIIVNIQDLSKDILRQAGLSTMGETRQIRHTTDRTEIMVEAIGNTQVGVLQALDDIRREQAESRFRSQQSMISQDQEERYQLDLQGSQRMDTFWDNLATRIANGVREELLGIAQKSIDEKMLSHSGITRPAESLHAQRLIQIPSYEQECLIFDTNYLLDLTDMTHIELPYEPTATLSLDTTAASRLEEWTTASGSQLLSVAGRRAKALEEAPMTVLAAMCVNFAKKTKLPVLSYFCELPKDEELRQQNTRETQELISLTYSLILQLIEQLPVSFESELDFSQERLSSLEETLKSWSEAVGILKDLIQLRPKVLFCIIDGFQVLDDWSTEQAVGDLIQALRGPAESDTRNLKVLITTTGRSTCITRELRPAELVLADRDGAVDSPARRGGNRRFAL